MDTLISIAVWAAFGIGCYKLAEKNGRSAGLAGVMGVLFGVFALLVYWFLGKKKSQAPVNKETPSTNDSTTTDNVKAPEDVNLKN